jgi:hypothetical protein
MTERDTRTLDAFIKAWRNERIAALREGDAKRAHDCQMKIDGLEGYRQSITASVAA